MLNTLANHNYLPHTGKNITASTTLSALARALHIPASLALPLHEAAVATNPNGPWSNSFDLDHLAAHNKLEHDASLSRQDAYFGDAVRFNASVFAQTTAFFPGDEIDVPQAAQARLARIRDSQTWNPQFELGAVGKWFGIGEVAVLILTMGDAERWTARRDVVEYLFEHERLPTAVGWSRPVRELALGDMYAVISEIVDLSMNVTGAKKKRTTEGLWEEKDGFGDIHGLAAAKAMMMRE